MTYYFLQEKRSDREIENLFSVIENAIEIKDNQIERLKHLSSANLPTLTSKLDEALAICDKIHNIELEKEKVCVLMCFNMSFFKIFFQIFYILFSIFVQCMKLKGLLAGFS